MKKTLKEQKERIVELMTQHSGGGYGPSTKPQERNLDNEKDEVLKSTEYSLRQLSYIITDPEELRTTVNAMLDGLPEEEEPDMNDEDEGPDANDIDSNGDEYDEQYNKNMSQGFSSINEGNAFVGAAKKAKEEGKDSFELDGKKYKVTITKKEK